jgi:hypothetical protein
MSSPDDRPDWSALSERAVGLEVELALSAAELTSALQQYRTDTDAARAEVAAGRREGLAALARQAFPAARWRPHWPITGRTDRGVDGARSQAPADQ